MVGRRSRHRSGFALLACIAWIPFLLTSCQQSIQVHGHLPEPEDLALVEPGVHTRNDVAQLLGSPSTMSTFSDRTWYYIGSKQESLAFLDPEILEQNVFAVSFDDTGLVQDTRFYSKVDGRTITPVERVTPAEGRELTILQQLFGNFGRFPTVDQQNQDR